MNTIHIFIPRILSNISKEYVVNTFREMDIGNIIYIDMHTRINEMGYRYSFAFITIELFESRIAHNIVEKMNCYGNAQIPYEERNYWEIKYFIPKENRIKNVVYAVEEPADPVNEAFVLSDDEDENDEEPSWLHDTNDDWKIDDEYYSSEEDTKKIINICDELLKTPEERAMERDFDELKRDIEQTVFVSNISVW